MKNYRNSSSLAAQRIWDAIKHIKKQDRKASDEENIARFCYANYGMEKEEVSQQIAYLVEDNLIKKVFNASKKGLNKGVEKIVFILPVSYVFTFRAVYFWHQHLFF